MNPYKIWMRIVEAFQKVEAEDFAVETITLPQRFLDVIIKEPILLGFSSGSLRDTLCYVENPTSRKNKKIWGAKVKIGTCIKTSKMKIKQKE